MSNGVPKVPIKSGKSRNARANDPVCGMQTEELAANMLEYEGRIFFFCSDDCKTRFKADPAKYAAAGKSEAAAMESHAYHGRRHGCC